MGLTYPEAIVVGLMQGVTELFPVSSLGHSVLLPALVGGRWASDLDVSAPESPYLAFVVGLHVATALALVVFFRRDWARIVGGLLTSVRDRSVTTPEQRLAWLMVLATIPVGVSGLLLEHTFRTVLGRPTPAAAFLVANGVILLAGERLRRRTPVTIGAGPAGAGPVGTGPAGTGPVGARPVGAGPARTGPAGAGAVGARAAGTGPAGTAAARTAAARTAAARTGAERLPDPDAAADQRLGRLPVGTALLVGSAQILALLPGISRSGVTMVGGLVRGLSHEDAARFSFLLATPVILAAGVLKLPDLAGPLGAGIHGQVLAGSLASGLAAYASVRWLTRWFTTRTLTPFALYSLIAGGTALLILGVR